MHHKMHYLNYYAILTGVAPNVKLNSVTRFSLTFPGQLSNSLTFPDKWSHWVISKSLIKILQEPDIICGDSENADKRRPSVCVVSSVMKVSHNVTVNHHHRRLGDTTHHLSVVSPWRLMYVSLSVPLRTLFKRRFTNARFDWLIDWLSSGYSLYHNCDSTTIWRCHDAFDYDGSDRKYDLRSIRLWYDYDEKLTCSFFACVELEARARDMLQSDRSRITIVITALPV